MALQTSGQISLNEIHIEAGGSSGTQCAINNTDIRGLIGKSSGAQMSFSEWYGAANEVTVTSQTAINSQSNRKQMLASDFVSSGGTLIVPANFWVWSDSLTTAALTIDVSCTVKNSGKIIGKGGGGGDSTAAQTGGYAIKINSGVTGVTIINYSGAYIAGGGGGGGDQGQPGDGGPRGGGGGGAGGGEGGHGGGTAHAYVSGGSSGILNASGGSGSGGAGGGGAGGGGGGWNHNGAGGDIMYSGGGGGRILPGTGGSGQGGGGTGGSGGNAGGNYTGPYSRGGGGGGWGANGGTGGASGGSGGKAIEDSGVSYTLTNSGTIYGGT